MCHPLAALKRYSHGKTCSAEWRHSRKMQRAAVKTLRVSIVSTEKNAVEPNASKKKILENVPLQHCQNEEKKKKPPHTNTKKKKKPTQTRNNKKKIFFRVSLSFFGAFLHFGSAAVVH